MLTSSVQVYIARCHANLYSTLNSQLYFILQFSDIFSLTKAACQASISQLYIVGICYTDILTQI
jgi:hypothetical protein